MSRNIISSFPVLSECFDSESSFLSFLEFCSDGLEIKKTLNPEIDLNLVGELFAGKGAPLSKTDIMDFLDAKISSDFNLELVIEFLVGRNKLFYGDGGFFPQGLRKLDAAACVLANNP
ncbi:hypothetical protein, partial [Halospina sp. K52047b]|uniref:hypothetical protein n=1 Tax=Halospina sp. K52047b TaxID=2614160 RepID=UPI00124A8F8D